MKNEKKTDLPIAGITPAGFACRKKRPALGHILYGATAGLCILLLDIQTMLTADMWARAETIVKDVYSRMLGVPTIAAVMTASVVLPLMNFSKPGRTAGGFRIWPEYIVIPWAIPSGLGLIVTYIIPPFSGG